jgi:hypothetical protein
MAEGGGSGVFKIIPSQSTSVGGKTTKLISLFVFGTLH